MPLVVIEIKRLGAEKGQNLKDDHSGSTEWSSFLIDNRYGIDSGIIFLYHLLSDVNIYCFCYFVIVMSQSAGYLFC